MEELLRIRIEYPQNKKQKTAFCRDYGMNAYYAGKHWSKRTADAEYWHSLTRIALRGRKVPVILPEQYPLTVEATFDDGLDCDNHMVMVKFILDGLKGYVFPEDDKRYINRIVLGYNELNTIQVVLYGRELTNTEVM